MLLLSGDPSQRLSFSEIVLLRDGPPLVLLSDDPSERWPFSGPFQRWWSFLAIFLLRNVPSQRLLRGGTFQRWSLSEKVRLRDGPCHG